MYYSSMSLEEFLKLNPGAVSGELENILLALLQTEQDETINAKQENKALAKRLELLEEQLSYGVALVEDIETFVTLNLSKRLQKEYGILRSDSLFET